MHLKKKTIVNKMAAMWFSVIVLVLVQQVFAVSRDCLNIRNIDNCDQCFRCGGNWCNDANEGNRCSSQAYDNWCPGAQEVKKYVTYVENEGTHINPKYRETTVPVHAIDRVDITYNSKLNEPKIKLDTNSTQTSNFDVTFVTECSDGSCTTIVKTAIGSNFCTDNGTTSEYVNVKVSIEGIEENLIMKLHVPCACKCSQIKDPFYDNKMCSDRGAFTCGSCACIDKWTGQFCEKPICEPDRGDIEDSNCADSGDNIVCSGNGFCNRCHKCECYKDREGSKYFDKSNCADICTTINNCDDCFLDPRPVRCDKCPNALYRLHYNETLMKQKDENNKNVWILCNSTIHMGTGEECNYEYAAMRKGVDNFYMVIKSCDPYSEGQTGVVSVTVPVVLGVIAILAAAAATVGYMMWKNQPTPVKPTSSIYQNIDAEECTGENPLYKPPTSSFKNPTYGKW